MRLVVRLLTCSGAFGGVLLAPADAQAFFRRGNRCAPAVQYGSSCPPMVMRCESVLTPQGAMTVCTSSDGRRTVTSDGSVTNPGTSSEIGAALQAIINSLELNAPTPDIRGVRLQLQDLVRTLNENDRLRTEAMDKKLKELTDAIKKLEEKGKN